MTEFFQECIHNVNLPATVLLVVMLMYWMLVIVGLVGLDAMDLDLDLDADVGLDADIGMDADVGDVGGGISTAPGTQVGGGSSTTGNEGALRALFDFFYLGEVPIVIIGTFFVFFFWIFTVVTNHLMNPEMSIFIAAAWLFPNILVSLVLTRYCMIPFAILFRKDGPEDRTRPEMVGVIGNVTTSEVTETFGQMEVKMPGEPEITLNVRTRTGKTLSRRDAARIISFDPDEGTFLVENTQWEKPSDV